MHSFNVQHQKLSYATENMDKWTFLSQLQGVTDGKRESFSRDFTIKVEKVL